MLARRSGTQSDHADMQHDETLFACPMHPEQVSHEPGRCPICGMDLEERTATPEELASLRLRKSDTDHVAHSPAHTEEQMGGDHYVCPEHAEIHSDKPGRCPIDGTFLEKRNAGAMSAEDAQ